MLLLSIFLLPHAHAITIHGPLEDVNTTTPSVEVDFDWEGNSSTYELVLTNSTDTVLTLNTTSTSHTENLTPESYTLVITGTNETNSTSFDVVLVNQTSPPVVLTVEAEESTYEVQDTARLTATASQQVTATLNILLNGNVLETYTLSITNSVGLIYIPEQPGTYTVTLTAEGQTVSTVFTVTQTPPLVVDFDYTTPEVDKQTTFTSTVTGGQPPYSYTWLFSDQTTSGGSTSQHYFFTAGSHDATLVVQDGRGEQTSVTKSFDVQDKTWDLELTVKDANGGAVPDITVEIDDGNGNDETKTTNNLGTVLFGGLRGNYSLELRLIGTVYYNGSVNISENTNLLLTINYSTPTNTTNTTVETNVTNTTVETNTTETVEPEPEPEEQVEDVVQTVAASEPEAPSAQEIQEEGLKAIREARFDMRLSAKKDQILTELDLYKRFDTATAAVEAATTQEQVDQALANVPQTIDIETEEAKLSYPDLTELESLTERYMTALNIQDESLHKDYAYSIERVAENVSVKTEFVQAKITFMDGSSEQHSIVRREVQAPPGVYTVEIIPKQFAATASQLSIEGDYEVVEEDPVLKFFDETYSYSVAKKSSEYGQYLVVPEEISSPSLLTGLVSFAFGKTDTSRALIYTVILFIIAVGLIAGPKLIARKGDGGAFDAFADIANEALTLISQGEKARAAHITPDILHIYDTLPQEQQEQLKDVIAHLMSNMHEQDFLHTVQDAYEHMGSGSKDVNALSAHYEHVLHKYETLSEEQQEQLKGHIDQLDTYLESVMQA